MRKKCKNIRSKIIWLARHGYPGKIYKYLLILSAIYKF